MILVAGGTGRLGSALVHALVEHGQAVRVLTRDSRRAAHLVELPVDIVVGDVRSPATLPAALAGAHVVVSAVHGFIGPGRVSPRSVDRDGNAHLIDAAAVVGADVVLLSVVGAAPDAPMSLHRAKYAAEQHLRASATAWTIVRSVPFVETWAEILAKPVVPGRGDNPITFVSIQDVAALVLEAVVDRRLRGRVLEIGGPEDLTMNEFAAAVQSSRSQPRTIHNVPRAIIRATAPFSRRARAALTMDTTTMTVDRAEPKDPDYTIGATDVATALRP